MGWECAMVAGPFNPGLTEGPAWEGQTLLFTHIPASRLMRYDPGSGQCTVFREQTTHANGLAFDSEGRLLGLELEFPPQDIYSHFQITLFAHLLIGRALTGCQRQAFSAMTANIRHLGQDLDQWTRLWYHHPISTIAFWLVWGELLAGGPPGGAPCFISPIQCEGDDHGGR